MKPPLSHFSLSLKGRLVGHDDSGTPEPISSLCSLGPSQLGS